MVILIGALIGLALSLIHWYASTRAKERLQEHRKKTTAQIEGFVARLLTFEGGIKRIEEDLNKRIVDTEEVLNLEDIRTNNMLKALEEKEMPRTILLSSYGGRLTQIEDSLSKISDSLVAKPVVRRRRKKGN